MNGLKYSILITALLLITANGIAQLVGNGTSGNPYRGSVSSSLTWTGEEIFARNLTITSTGTLTITAVDANPSYLNMSAFDLIIQAGGKLILDPNTHAAVGDIENNGLIQLESTATESGVASLLHDTYHGTGIFQIRLYLTGGQLPNDDHIWHYISPPVSGITATSFGTLNLAQYVESLATSSNNLLGWVAYDGYQYETRNTLGSAYQFSILELGRGYNYYNTNDNVFTFTGAPIATRLNRDLSWGGLSDYQGYNLVGNPFVSVLDWESLIARGGLLGLESAIYFTREGQIAAYVSGVGVNGGSQYIAPMQGFFVKANVEDPMISFPPGARTRNDNTLRYKKKSSADAGTKADSIPMVRLMLTTDDGKSDLVVRFHKKATNGFDGTLDAHLFSRTAGDFNVWTTSGSTDYAINALPFPEQAVELPVGLNSKLNTTFRLAAKEIKKLEPYNILLKDLVTGQVADLRKGEAVEFASDAGMIENRFVLVITKSSTGIDSPEATGPGFRIFALPGKQVGVQATGGTDELIRGDVEIYDLSGKRIMQKSNIEWAGSGDIRQFPVTRSGSGIYMVVVNTGQKQYTEKVAIH